MDILLAALLNNVKVIGNNMTHCPTIISCDLHDHFEIACMQQAKIDVVSFIDGQQVEINGFAVSLKSHKKREFLVVKLTTKSDESIKKAVDLISFTNSLIEDGDKNQNSGFIGVDLTTIKEFSYVDRYSKKHHLRMG